MSLLSEDKSNVGECDYLVTNNLNIIRPVKEIDVPLSSGRLKQIVGYASPRNELWTLFYNLETGLPMKLPQGYMMIQYYMSAKADPLKVNGANESYTYLEIVADPNDPENDYYEPSNNGWYDTDVNGMVMAEEDLYTSGLYTEGYYYPALYNDYYPDPAYFYKSGTVKLVILYV